MIVIEEVLRAGRRVLHRPASAIGIATTLTIGIAVSVSMFSVLYGVVLRALPYPDAERIVTVHAENVEQGLSRTQLTPAEAIEALQHVPGFEHTAYYSWGGLTFTGDDTPRIIELLLVSLDYFQVFGVPAALGRTLIGADFTEHRLSAVLNHAAWLDLTGGDVDAIGQTLSFQGLQFELVGVLPESFAHPDRAPRVYRTLPDGMFAGPGYLDAQIGPAVGRLAAGVSPALADDGLQARLRAVHDAHGATDRDGWRLRQVALIDTLLGDVDNVLFTLFAVSMLVLLTACSTAACLVSIRLRQRRTELALRRALGAGHGRIALDVSLELLLLATLAAIGGVLLAYAVTDALQALPTGTLPRGEGIGVDRTALLFAAAVTSASLLLSGTAPLLRALRDDPADSLHSGSRREVGGGLHDVWLPTAGIGLSTVALVTALALATSLIRLGNLDPGFRTDGITALQVFRGPGLTQFVERAFEELRAIPGVRDVAAIRSPPLDAGARYSMDVVAQHELPEPLPVDTQRASAGYHDFLGIPVLRGRDIAAGDVADAPNVTVINETLARRVFGTADPIGRTLTLNVFDEPVPFEVVGVAADTLNVGLRAPPGPEMVIPIPQFQEFPYSITLLVDASAAPPNWIRTLEEAVWRVDPGQAIYRSFMLSADLDAQMHDARFFATATGGFAILALLLGAIGINAVVAAMQRRRTREIGLRIALGATPARAAAGVFGTAASVVGPGLAIGALLAVPVPGRLRHQLFGVDTGTFWLLFAITAAVLVVAAAAAAAWPAWRASRIAPMEALRHQ